MSALTDPGTGLAGPLGQVLFGAGYVGGAALGGAPWWAILGTGLLVYMIGTVRVLLVTKMETARDLAVAKAQAQQRGDDQPARARGPGPSGPGRPGQSSARTVLRGRQGA